MMARLTTEHWLEQLPWVMLGLRTTPKPELGASPSELVYGTPLVLPGEFLGGQADPESPADLLHRVRDHAAHLAPIPTAWHSTPKPHEPTALRLANFVFIRRDARRAPLQRPYEGPFKVIERGPKTFKVVMGNREETVSVDRLKAAIIDPSDAVVVAIPPKRGRPRLQPEPAPTQQEAQMPSRSSGRTVTRPARFQT